MTSNKLTAGIAKTEFELTPYYGDQMRGMQALAHEAGVRQLVDGHGMIYTSAGHNLAGEVMLAQLGRFIAGQVGDSFCAGLEIRGGKLVVSRGQAFVGGVQLMLQGAEKDGSQLFALDGLPVGRYALVLETWDALVGITTYGRSTIPSFFAGVENKENKPSKTTLYAAGNVQATQFISDQSAVTSTLETQRIVQSQYILRLIPERDLRGVYATAAHPLDRAATVYAGDGDVLTALSPLSETSNSVAIDRAFKACKLAIVRIEDTGATLEINAQHLHREASGKGQSPLPMVPNLSRYQRFVTSEIERLDVAGAGDRVRLEALEQLREAGVYEAGLVQPVAHNHEQVIQFTRDVRDPLGWHDHVVSTGRFICDFAGQMGVSCHAVLAAGGGGIRALKLKKNGLETDLFMNTAAVAEHQAALQLVGELDVVAGDVLEVYVLQVSEQAAPLQLERARLTLRRLG